MPKTLSLRLPDEQAATLEMVARADGQTFTDAVRQAIDEHIDARRKDQAFRDRLKSLREQEADLYKRLAS